MADGRLRAITGVERYDRARWSQYVPTIERVHSQSGLVSLFQRLPLDQTRVNEVEVPPPDATVLLYWVEPGREAIDFRLAEEKHRFRMQSWDGILIPAHCDSWYATTRLNSDHIFHLHLETTLIKAVVAAENWRDEARHLPPIQRLRDPTVAMLGRWAFAALEGAEPPSRLVWETIGNALAMQLLRLTWGMTRSTFCRGGLSSYTLNKVTAYLRDRLAVDVSLTELAAVANLSPSHFCRAFKESTGAPPHAWLTSRRMERAQELMLAHPQMGLTDVALCVGYANQAAFGTAFRREVGVTPSRWRRERTS